MGDEEGQSRGEAQKRGYYFACCYRFQRCQVGEISRSQAHACRAPGHLHLLAKPWAAADASPVFSALVSANGRQQAHHEKKKLQTSLQACGHMPTVTKEEKKKGEKEKGGVNLLLTQSRILEKRQQ